MVDSAAVVQHGEWSGGAARRPTVVRSSSLGRSPADWAALSVEQLVVGHSAAQWSAVVQGAVDPPSSVRLAIADYVQYMEQTPDADPLYLFEYELPPLLLRAAAAARPALLGPPDILAQLAAEAPAAAAKAEPGELMGEGCGRGGCERPRRISLLDERQWVVLGPAGSGSRWHTDPHATDAWNLLIDGRKLWAFWPPGEPGESETDGVPPGVPVLPAVPGARGAIIEAPAAVEWFELTMLPLLQGAEGTAGAAAAASAGSGGRRLQWVEQLPGDVVLVPHGWWHAVLNVAAVNCAFTQNEVRAANLRAAHASLRHAEPALAAALARWAARQRTDSSDSES